jgi:hypothetical protein
MSFALYSPKLASMSRYTKANHRIFMQLVRRDVWYVTFLEPGLERLLPKKLTFKDEGKIRELARRGEAWQTSEDRQMLDYADNPCQRTEQYLSSLSDGCDLTVVFRSYNMESCPTRAHRI